MRLKKVLALMLAGSMALAMTACGGSDDNESTTAAQTTEGNEDTTAKEEGSVAENEDTTASEENDTTDSEEDTTEAENTMELRIENGTLYISGEGPMVMELPESADENWVPEDSQPWGDRWDEIGKIVIEEGITTIQSYSFAREEIYYADPLEVEIADTVEAIGHYAFYNQFRLPTIELPDSVMYIGECAFYNCTFESIELPANLKEIDEAAFYQCTYLKEIKLPEGLEKIGRVAFYFCDIDNLYIPESVTEIGESIICDTGEETISGKAGSAAETYANENGIEFIAQ